MSIMALAEEQDLVSRYKEFLYAKKQLEEAQVKVEATTISLKAMSNYEEFASVEEKALVTTQEEIVATISAKQVVVEKVVVEEKIV